MLRLVRTVECEDLNSRELSDFLDSRFHPDLAAREGSALWAEEESQQRWGEEFIKKLPKTNHELLFDITRATTSYHMQNCVGRVCMKYVWKEFFKVFPLGRILLVNLPLDWLTSIWDGERTLATQMGFSLEDSLATPQGMSGLQAANFPLNSMPLAACGIYPLTFYDFVHTSADLIFVYVPDRAIEHSQMLEAGAYSNVLWRFHHIFDDQWTFDGFRGPKSAACGMALNPVKNLEYFAWYFERVGERMTDVLAIGEPLRREQLCMTFSRAVSDCVLSISAQLPYMSKVFFFACVDKISNLSVHLEFDTSERDAWNRLTDASFLSNELGTFLQEVPGPAGSYLRGIVEWAADNMRIDKVTPTVLRDIRSSHHGYALRPDVVSRLFAASGELHNDITLLTTPLLLYVLGQTWK